MMTQACYVFAGGGTGGHLYPGLAVADAVRRRDPDARIIFLTTNRPLDRRLLAPTEYEQIEQAIQPFTLHPKRVFGFARSWFTSVRAARAFLGKIKPRAVLGLGGYAAGPPVSAARKLGVKAGLLNPDAIPGRANRFLARKVDLVAMQWETSRRFFPTNTRCEVTGCPIRAEFAAADRAAGRAHFGLEPDRPVLLVTGASQGARTVNRAMQLVWPEFAREHSEWRLLHLTGPADKTETREAYREAGVSAIVKAFTHEMWLAIAAADVVTARAGASTLAELAAVGRPAVLLPYPYHRDRHQHANARVLVEAGAAFVLEDRLEPALNRDPLLAALRRLANNELRSEMARAAKRLGITDAAESVASWMIA